MALFNQKVYAKIQNQPINKLDKNNRLIRWGKDNLFPVDLIEVVGRSGIANSAINSVASYIQGEGFLNTDSPALNDFVKRNFAAHLPALSKQEAKWDSVAVQLIPNAAGYIAEINPIDVSTLRVRVEETTGLIVDYLTCREWKRVKTINTEKNDLISFEEKVTRFLPWTGQERGEVIADISRFAEKGEKFNGYILYIPTLEDGDSYYATPSYWAAANAIYLDGEIDALHVDNVDNNFITSAIIAVVADLTGKDERGRTKGQAFTDDLEARHVTRGKKGKLTVISAKDKDSMPSILPFQPADMGKLFETAQLRAQSKIMRTMRCPEIIFGDMATGGLGSTKQIQDTIALLNDRVLPHQQKICDMINSLLPFMYGYNADLMGGTVSISQKYPISYLPDWFIQSLPVDEQRKMYGFAPLEQPTP